MNTYTNHTPGARGINTMDGTVWIEPGQSIELDPKSIVGDVPDLGSKRSSAEPDTADIKALTAKVAELTKQVEELTKGKAEAEKANAELTKQVEELTKPAK